MRYTVTDTAGDEVEVEADDTKTYVVMRASEHESGHVVDLHLTPENVTDLSFALNRARGELKA